MGTLLFVYVLWTHKSSSHAFRLHATWNRQGEEECTNQRKGFSECTELVPAKAGTFRLRLHCRRNRVWKRDLVRLFAVSIRKNDTAVAFFQNTLFCSKRHVLTLFVIFRQFWPKFTDEKMTKMTKANYPLFRIIMKNTPAKFRYPIRFLRRCISDFRERQ